MEKQTIEKSAKYRDPKPFGDDAKRMYNRSKCTYCSVVYGNAINLVNVREGDILGNTRRYTMRICNKCLESFSQTEMFAGVEEYSLEDTPAEIAPVQPEKDVIRPVKGYYDDDMGW